jgi:hypothetical protein
MLARPGKILVKKGRLNIQPAITSKPINIKVVLASFEDKPRLFALILMPS